MECIPGTPREEDYYSIIRGLRINLPSSAATVECIPGTSWEEDYYSIRIKDLISPYRCIGCWVGNVPTTALLTNPVCFDPSATRRGPNQFSQVKGPNSSQEWSVTTIRVYELCLGGQYNELCGTML